MGLQMGVCAWLNFHCCRALWPLCCLLVTMANVREEEFQVSEDAFYYRDNTYEHFVYDDREHVCLDREHIIHIFSFSKVLTPSP
jgi:hypothetical protein